MLVSLFAVSVCTSSLVKTVAASVFLRCVGVGGGVFAYYLPGVVEMMASDLRKESGDLSLEGYC